MFTTPSLKIPYGIYQPLLQKGNLLHVFIIAVKVGISMEIREDSLPDFLI
jgi:hypothetical protein